jgi:hypothetical protein
VTAILASTLTDFAGAFPALKKVAQDPRLAEVARPVIGQDGRGLRKLVSAAMLTRNETTLDPSQLTIEDLLVAAMALASRPATHVKKGS